jgi:hypothetical protein
MQASVLTPHPNTPCAAVRRIEVDLHIAGATLELRYTVEGDIERLLIPAQSPARRADKLWQHTCFEAFVAQDPTAGYYELNFSPSTEWAIYRFSAYRQAMAAVEAHHPPRICVHREPGRLRLEASIALALLPALRDSPALRLALCAVIEEVPPRLSYWALVHPAAKPDFHQPAGFALSLSRDEPGSSGLTTCRHEDV